MATTNPAIGTSWTKLVATGDEFTLGVGDDQTLTSIALAVTDADSAPEVTGQVMNTPTNTINRALTGPGYLWAKSRKGVAVTAWLHSWTPV